ncbi:hypothetical protein HPB48_026585 [Haemaphysalis longicornis]|uniref:Proteasome activator Blm10 middle HEAT repeats region domain-containing protein n=1 Tax=Haemaphysalis longicornis TaxID=44386 RepID=A0A9J6HCJ4_HAELO|nr:hypothetical protein HPB48_026585 [Haemaphysalis longicornis]
MKEEELSASLQKPLMYNRLLPYSASIDDEAEKLFAEIKMNLGRCVALREVTPVAGYWLAQLHSFLELYGYHFTKTDHIVLVEFLLELLVIRGLDLVIVGQLAHAISLLLKRRELLSRDQLCIQWRPLYELYERLECSRDRELGLLRPPANLATRLETMVACCRVYFSAASTIEMLEEWLPLLCPFDRSMQKAMAYFQLFLPTTLPPDQHGLGFRLWFDNFIEIWENSHNSPEWENAKLHNVLFHLPTQVVRRLHRERYQQVSWEQPPPESHRMSDADVADFVQCLAPVVLVTMGYEGEHPGAAFALHELASLRPDMVIPPVLERTPLPDEFTLLKLPYCERE